MRASDFPRVADGVGRKTRNNFRAFWVSRPRGMFLAISVTWTDVKTNQSVTRGDRERDR